MAKALKVCAAPGCTTLTPHSRCPTHTHTPWQRTTPRNTTLSGWAQQRRAQQVQFLHDGICHICGLAGANQVDHVIPLAEGGADTMDNLKPAHGEPCHRLKSQAEATRARTRA